MHYHGDDCRLARVALRDHPRRARVTDLRNDPARARRLRAAARWCDAAVVGDLELLGYVRPYFARVYLLPLCVDLGNANRLRKDRSGPPLVLHAASDPAVKGTADVRRAFEDMARRVDMRWRVVAGRGHAELLAELDGADLVVDQLNSETYGVFAVEAMARGKPVLCEIDRAKLAPWARSVPIAEVAPDTLASRLEALMTDAGERERLGVAGRAFAAHVHASERVAAAAEHMYEHLAADPAPGVYAATPEGVRPTELT
jgi:hypothetical protein